MALADQTKISCSTNLYGSNLCPNITALQVCNRLQAVFARMSQHFYCSRRLRCTVVEDSSDLRDFVNDSVADVFDEFPLESEGRCSHLQIKSNSVSVPKRRSSFESNIHSPWFRPRVSLRIAQRTSSCEVSKTFSTDRFRDCTNTFCHLSHPSLSVVSEKQMLDLFVCTIRLLQSPQERSCLLL